MNTAESIVPSAGPQLRTEQCGPVVRVTFSGTWSLDTLPASGPALRKATSEAADALRALRSSAVPVPKRLPDLSLPSLASPDGSLGHAIQPKRLSSTVQADHGHPTLELRAENLSGWDSSLLVPITQLITLAGERGISVLDQELPHGLRNLIRLALAIPARADSAKSKHTASFLERLADAALAIPKASMEVFSFIGELVLSFGRLFRGRSACTRANVWLALQEASVGALPIVSLICLLVGLILAFVGVIQLSMFGAEIYVSSLVAVSMTRIMGAIMTGIILSGRTGAAYAAVIGTMQVNEEIDALTTLGVAPSDYLVLPRIIALTLITPLLIVYADAMGILGGFLVGVGVLGLDPMEYITFTQKGFVFSNVWVGMIHGAVFGLVIAITGCYQGLHCGRNAEAVGQATTAAVVCSIVGIVLATAVLTLIFNVLKI